jgi:hypothetical protein
MAVGAEQSSPTGIGASWYFNGSTWSFASVPLGSYTAVNYIAVSCVAASFCLTTGYGYNSGAGNHQENIAAFWNGASWNPDSSIPEPNPSGSNALYGVDCLSSTYCTAVGGTATATSNGVSLVLNWNGQSWDRPTTPTGPSSGQTVPTGVSCLTGWACVAVGLTASAPLANFLPYDLMAPIARSGYRFVASDGGIFNYGPSSGGGAPFLGSMGGQPLNKPIVGMATMPAGDGYYLVASDGGIFNFGSAQFYGSTGAITLNKPIVGMAVTPDGGGYWLVASDGGIFNYGDAPFYGSMGGQPLNKPIVGMAATPNGNGYYLVASDGGIFTFPTMGGPPFLGSTGAITLNKPIVGMAVTPAGQYYLVASDGGIFSFPSNPSGPPFFGSTGAIKLNQPVVGMSIANGGMGYYLGAADGGIFSFPTGPSGPVFYGSRGGQPLNKPIVGISG